MIQLVFVSQLPDCADDYIIGETKRIVKLALEQLTDIQRERIYMKYWDKMTIREIAKKEGKDHKTILESLRSAEKKLRNIIKIPPQ